MIRSSLAATQLLRDRGVKYAFGVPGESFLGLLDALYDTPEIDLVTCRHEGGAAFMADAAAKLIGQPSICMGTRGVGTANLAIGIHTAYQDSTPMLAMVGQVETPFRHREALQEVELAAFLGEITKWSVEPPSASELPRLVSEAYRLSMSGRPGPVGIVLRGDILEEDMPEPDLPITAPIETAVSARTARKVVELLENAKQPVIISGGGVLRAEAVPALVELAEAIGIPVATAFRRLDAFPTDHPAVARLAFLRHAQAHQGPRGRGRRGAGDRHAPDRNDHAGLHDPHAWRETDPYRYRSGRSRQDLSGHDRHCRRCASGDRALSAMPRRNSTGPTAPPSRWRSRPS